MTIIGKASVVLDGDTIALTKSLAGAEAAMTAAGVRMASIGRSMMMHLSLPMVATGGMAVKMAAEFDSSMRRIEGLVGIARDQIEAWEPAIHEMASASGKSAHEAADALFFITSAGLRGDAALNVLNTSLRAAAAGLGETKTIADAATSAMNAYGQANMSAERAVEIITVAVREGKMEAESLAPTLGKVISVAANLGVEFEQVAGVLAVFSRVGVDAAMGTTQLSAIMSGLMKSNRQGAAELEKVGLSYKMLRDMIRGPTGLIDVMRLLDERFGDNEDALTKVIPNLRALRGEMAIIGQRADVVNTIMGNVRNSQGVLNKAFAAAAAGPMLQMKIVWAKLGDNMEALGRAILPALVPMLQKIGAVVGIVADGFDGLSTGTKGFVVVLGGFVIATGPVIWALGKMLTSAKLLFGVLKVFPAALAVARMCMVDFAASMAGAKVIGAGLSNGLYYGLKGALMTLGNLLSPQGVILAGLAALAYLFVKTQMAVADTRREIMLATEKLHAFLATRTPSSAAAQILLMDVRLAGLRRAIADTERQLNPSAGLAQASSAWLVGASRNAGTLTDDLGRVGAAADTVRAAANRAAANPAARTAERQALQERLDGFRASVTALVAERKILFDIANIPPPATHPPIPGSGTGAGDLGDAVKEAMDALLDAQRQAAMLGTLGASSLEVMAAQAEAVRSALLALAGAGATENTVLNAQGLTLGQLVTRYDGLRAQTDSLTDVNTRYDASMARLDAAWEEAGRIIEQVQTPLERYDTTVAELTAHLNAGRLSQDQFNKAVAAAKKTMNTAQQQANTLDAAMKQWAANSLDAFINFTVDGQQSFKEFADSVLKDLARIALKMLIMQELKSLGISLPGFAAGGFIAPGQLALVGEAGPEVISGGRGGLTVTPMRMPNGIGGRGGRGGDVFHVQTTLAPRLLDGRDGDRWLRERSGVITEIIIDGVRRSAAARAAIAGG